VLGLKFDRCHAWLVAPRTPEKAVAARNIEDIMTVGIVKFFSVQKGFGFIAPEDGSPDVFVHISAVERSGLTTLRDGQRVSFDAVTDPRRGKTSAQNIRTV